MPADWNGKLRHARQRRIRRRTDWTAGPQRSLARVMKRGYAVAATDTGHSAVTEPGGTFAATAQKLLDYAFRSLHVTAEAAKMVLRSYYGAAPAKSYFEGCSTGGRQGLILAQRFPNDFDGITVGAPVLNFTRHDGPLRASGKAFKAAPIAATKLPTLASKIYDKCDAIDGIKDGVIDDPRRCDFQPARDLPKCAAGRRIARTASPRRRSGRSKTIYTPVKSQGKSVFPAWPVGAEAPAAERSQRPGPVDHSRWRTDAGHVLRRGLFPILAFPKPDPNTTSISSISTRICRSWRRSTGFWTPPIPTSRRFRDHGGRIFMYFGWADPALNPMMGVEYYQAVTKRMGPKTTDFFRLFMVPGMLHCGDGAGRISSIPWVRSPSGWKKAPRRMRCAANACGRQSRAIASAVRVSRSGQVQGLGIARTRRRTSVA